MGNKGKKDGRKTELQGENRNMKAKGSKRQKGGRQKRSFGLSIRFQLVIGFLIPVLFIVLVGSISYLKASSGLTENYKQSSMNALRMTMNAMDESMTTIQSNVMELCQDSTVMAYSLGGYRSDSVKESSAKTSITNILSVKETASDMISSIHIIPEDGIELITTKKMKATGMVSFMNGLESSEDSGLLADNYVQWHTSHPYVDQQLEIDPQDYALSCSRRIVSGDVQSVVIIDISTESVRNLLNQLDFGEGSQISYITQDGKEISTGDTITMAGTDFYEQGKGQAENGYAAYIDYDGASYYFMMYPSAVAGGYVCALVPERVITENSKDIRDITVILVFIACVVALVISSITIRSIGRNIQRSVKRLDRVAQGELLEEAVRENNRKTEFGRLHMAICTTVHRMRELVETVKDMIGQVQAAGSKVSDSSSSVGVAVQNMGVRIQEIHQNIEREDEEIAACSQQMEELSGKINSVSSSVEEIMNRIGDSQAVVSDGMEAVKNMTAQSHDTLTVTNEVQQHVALLENKIQDISDFVEKIQAVAEETNLLSLNASIEAARAGENGRGFSVVAEEIRSLAGSSADLASSIQRVIEEICQDSGKALDKARSAETIVSRQVERVQNTAEIFQSIDVYMGKLEEQIETVTENVKEMNQERYAALSSIKVIGELSVGTVRSANEVNDSLQEQITCVEEMAQEAARLKRDMEELEHAVASFKLNRGELEAGKEIRHA